MVYLRDAGVVFASGKFVTDDAIIGVPMGGFPVVFIEILHNLFDIRVY